MPKKAEPTDTVDPVRSRLAQAAASFVAPAVRPIAAEPTPTPVKLPEIAPVNGTATVGEGSIPLPARRPAKPVVSARATVNRKIVVTADEAERMEQSTDMISAAFGGRVNYSQVSRAMWSVLADAEDAMQTSIRRATKRTAPSKGNPTGMAEYEQDLAEFLGSVLKRP